LRDQPVIIRDSNTLSTHYNQLSQNDIICGRICMHGAEEAILTDLLERGVRLIPSATAQLASRSKVFQARIFSDFMLPGTLPVYNRQMLLKTCSLYYRNSQGKVILKRDHNNAGLGIHLFDSIEDVYNLVALNSFAFPFVIAPYQEKFRDIRVIILDDYVEAYERTNPFGFRKNLHWGGRSTVFQLSDDQLRFCRNVMERGRFAYAHIDLMILDNDLCYLTEINLRGGLKGARISGMAYKGKIAALHETFLNSMLSGNK
jgi:ribosomal protein S6--L-glutamate ligase